MTPINIQQITASSPDQRYLQQDVLLKMEGYRKLEIVSFAVQGDSVSRS